MEELLVIKAHLILHHLLLRLVRIHLDKVLKLRWDAARTEHVAEAGDVGLEPLDEVLAHQVDEVLLRFHFFFGDCLTHLVLLLLVGLTHAIVGVSRYLEAALGVGDVLLEVL